MADQAVVTPLPELASVPWRVRIDAARLRRRGELWTATTVVHVVPFLIAAAALVAIQPLALPVALACLAHAWVIPALYAARGANVVRARPAPGAEAPERVALGLLGDLLGHDARELHARTGLVLEPGRLGTWLVGPAGALLVRRGRLRRAVRVDCWCVNVPDPGLPVADRISHLLLALRADEAGFATVANLAFSGASWRVRRRIDRCRRSALAAAVAHERAARPPVGRAAAVVGPPGGGSPAATRR